MRGRRIRYIVCVDWDLEFKFLYGRVKRGFWII